MSELVRFWLKTLKSDFTSTAVFVIHQSAGDSEISIGLGSSRLNQTRSFRKQFLYRFSRSLASGLFSRSRRRFAAETYARFSFPRRTLTLHVACQLTVYGHVNIAYYNIISSKKKFVLTCQMGYSDNDRAQSY